MSRLNEFGQYFEKQNVNVWRLNMFACWTYSFFFVSYNAAFHLFCKENGCQNETVNNSVETVLKYENLKMYVL